MKFTAYTYELGKPKLSISVLFTYIAIGLWILIFLTMFLEGKFSILVFQNDIFFLPMIIGLVCYLIAFVYQFFEYEQIENYKNGLFEINDNGIVLKYTNQIPFDKISDLKINAGTYYGMKLTNQKMNPQNPSPFYSSGLKNKIKISTDESEYELNIGFESEFHLKSLYSTIFELIISDKLKKIHLKNAINLISVEYRETREYKEYIAKLLTEKRLNCTDGLLLYGYKSDKEAQELRKKYCS